MCANGESIESIPILKKKREIRYRKFQEQYE